MDANPKIIVIAGCNGAGKSTLAPHLLRDTLGLNDYVNADTIAQGLSAFSPEKVAVEAGRVLLRRLYDLAERRQNFAFESTLATRFYAKWIVDLKRAGYEFDLFFIWLKSPELAIRRVEERVRLGGHSIPEATIRRRYLRGLVNFHKLYQPVADSWTVYDNSSSDAPTLVADKQEESQLTIHDELLWTRICQLKGPE
jgi:predicted ABC-type ATPase